MTVTGEWRFTNPAVVRFLPEPVVALMDVSVQIQGNFADWVPRTGQILGTLTAPFTSPPAQYQVSLPIVPTGRIVDLDNDGQNDAGVQVFALTVGGNLVGDSYLEQLEQVGFSSLLADPQTGAIREGAVLVWAPDSEQRFPSGAGADGRYFTADDPLVVLPRGYSLANLSRDGEVRFDRSREARMDILEAPGVAPPDFSGQGILESYNSLIDMLAVRYAYTELRRLDWEQIRQRYLPRVEQADAAGDMPAYYLALFDLAQSIHDSHVQVSATDPAVRVAPFVRLGEQTAGSLGASVAELSDGRFIVTYVDPNGPGAQAGWRFGTEIVSVDGVPMGERIDSLPYATAESTAEGIRLARLVFALSFPAGSVATVAYRQPGEHELRQATMTAGAEYRTAPEAGEPREEISFKRLDGGYGYIQWDAFDDSLYELAVWQKFLATFKDSPGMVIDLRGNVGGSVILLDTMASFLFTADRPAPLHWMDEYVYDEAAGDLVLQLPVGYTVSAPRPELAFTGAVAVLVDEGSASSAEYFPQFLQRQGRAVVVGEHGTDGAGGFIDRAALPGSIRFQFTKGRTVFAGTDEPNIEGKGVSLDVRVPITEEGERAKREGRDPVVEAAMAALAEESVRLSRERLIGATWRWTVKIEPSTKQSPIEDPDSFTVEFGENGTLTITADCNRAFGTYSLDGEGGLTISLGPATLAACPGGSFGEDFLKWLGAATSLQVSGDELVIMVNPESGVLALQLAAAARAVQWSDRNSEERDIMHATDSNSGVEKPGYVRNLEASFGPPSQQGFGSAVFFERIGAGDSLEKSGLSAYRTFVGDLWQRYGEAAWMGPWKKVYSRGPEGSHDIAAELQSIGDPAAKQSVPMMLDGVEDADRAKTALATAYDDPAVTELEVFNIGDGGAMSGLLVAGRRPDSREATFLVFLMD